MPFRFNPAPQGGPFEQPTHASLVTVRCRDRIAARWQTTHSRNTSNSTPCRSTTSFHIGVAEQVILKLVNNVEIAYTLIWRATVATPSSATTRLLFVHAIGVRLSMMETSGGFVRPLAVRLGCGSCVRARGGVNPTTYGSRCFIRPVAKRPSPC